LSNIIIITLGGICLGLVIRLFILQRKLDTLFVDMVYIVKEYNQLTERFEDTTKMYSKLTKHFRKQIEEEGFDLKVQ